jgi:hypothetical protein
MVNWMLKIKKPSKFGKIILADWSYDFAATFAKS